MAEIWIPALMQDLTGGEERVQINADTVREVIDQLEDRFPGIKGRLMEAEQLRPGIAVVVDGEVSRKRLRQRLEERSEVHFLPAISGG